MKENEELIRIRDIFREAADLTDKLLELKARQDDGEDVKEEVERVAGKYMFLMLELDGLNQ